MIVFRSLVFNIWFFVATVIMGSAGIPVRWFAQRHALAIAQRWAALVLDGADFICGIRTVVIGREHLTIDGPALIAAQHQSAFDTMIWLRLLPRTAYVFKSELARVPLFGPLLVPSGQIPVDRGASFSAVRSLLRGADRAKADGRQIVIFPEGTRVTGGGIGPLRPGIAALAARTKLPVIPVATDSGRRWGRRAFLKRPGPVHIVICKAIPPGLPQDELIEAIRQSWLDARVLMTPVDKPVHGFAPAGPN